MFESRFFAGAIEKLPQTKATGKPDAETISSWSNDMEGHAEKCVKRYCELANKTTQQFSKSQRHVWMTINLKKKKLNQLENYLQFAHTCFWNVCIWLVLGDPIFCGLWTNLRVLKQNWQKSVPNAWRVWSRTFITQVSTSNIVMWETQHNNTDKDYFKILILQETLKTRSQHQEEFCAFSEVEHLCQ